MAEERRAGRSRISDKRSALRDMRRASFRRSRTSFSVLRLYLVEKATASESSFGISSWSLPTSAASSGRAVRRLERWSDDAIIAALDRAERDWRERRVECEDWDKDWGSVEVREVKESVERRLRYFAVTGSLKEGEGRGEGGVFK